MAKYQDGELIVLYFEDYTHPEFVKGEVSLDHAQKVVVDYHGDDLRVTEVTHKYAFWGVGQDEMGEKCQILYTRDEPGRGRFKVTECTCEWAKSDRGDKA
jgi:hypothetical protein